VDLEERVDLEEKAEVEVEVGADGEVSVISHIIINVLTVLQYPLM
jgi:hypothetical protein